MKRSTRYFCVLLCFVSLFTAFSFSVNAEEVKVKKYSIQQSNTLCLGANGSCYNAGSLTYTPNNDEVEKNSNRVYDSTFSTYSNLKAYSEYSANYIISYNDKSPILEGGKSYKLRFNNMYYSVLVETYAKTYYLDDPIDINVTLLTTDGTYITLHDISCIPSPFNHTFDIFLPYTPEKDVKEIHINAKTDIASTLPYATDHTVGLTFYCGEHDGDDKFVMKIDEKSGEEEKLDESIGWLEKIKNGISDLGGKIGNLLSAITDGFADLGSKIGNLLSAITELPQKLWNLISDGLKSLFVPDEDTITRIQTEFDEMLHVKFGGLYDVVFLIFDMWDSVASADKTNTVSMPRVTIPLPDGNEFTFGGYDVRIVPDGFDYLANMVKFASGIVCTIMFINGMRKRYDDLMGGS